MSKQHSKKSSKSSVSQFPRIYRLITEKKLVYAKLVLFGFVTTLLIVGIVMKVVEARQGLQTIKLNTTKHNELVAQKIYWEDIVRTHPGYRDATFKLAVLSLQLGAKNDAKKYIDLTLQIDPNFTQGRAFAQSLNN